MAVSVQLAYSLMRIQCIVCKDLVKKIYNTLYLCTAINSIKITKTDLCMTQFYATTFVIVLFNYMQYKLSFTHFIDMYRI